MAVDEDVTSFAAEMAAVAPVAPAGALVAPVNVWWVPPRGKLHLSRSCVTGLTEAQVDLVTTAPDRLCGKCWTHLPGDARRLQLAARALARAVDGLQKSEAVVESGDATGLAVSAGWSLRARAVTARRIAGSDVYPEPMRAWAVQLAERAEELAPRADAILAEDPQREVREAALTLLEREAPRPPRRTVKSRLTPVPGRPGELAPSLTAGGQFATGQDGLLAEAWAAWRNTVQAGAGPVAAERAAVEAAGLDRRAPMLLVQLPDVPAPAGMSVREAAAAAWRQAGADELAALCAAWAARFAELAADTAPVLVGWARGMHGWGSTATRLLARAGAVETGRKGLAVLPAVCATLLESDGVDAKERTPVRRVPLAAVPPAEVLASAARLWSDAVPGTPLEDPAQALAMAAATHDLPNPVAS